MRLALDHARHFWEPEAFEKKAAEAARIRGRLYAGGGEDADTLGWISCEAAAGKLNSLKDKAQEVYKQADVLVVVGVGGSNQAARAVIEALPHKGPAILYAGNTLSPFDLSRVLDQIEGKNVYLHVIAKNFETLEPGSHYRVLRSFLKKWYTPGQMAERVVITGTENTRLHEIARENGHLFLPFPKDIGGRYSAFSPVALFPLASAGLDIQAYLEGGAQMEASLRRGEADHPALMYAAARNCLYERGFDVEQLVAFEPRFQYFSMWWRQLFGESEGKEHKGIFPCQAIYSEDLHAIGQYLQEGRRCLMETFLDVLDPGTSVVVPEDVAFRDGFDYLAGQDFAGINRKAQEATISAHSEGGVPCLRLTTEKLNERAMGELFYFFMAACAVSGKLLGVNPFDQEGVEAYKRSMFTALGKPTK